MTTFVYKSPALHYEPWSQSGIEHGFTDVTLSFKEGVWAENWEMFCKRYQLRDLIIDKQIHGSEVVDLRNGDLLQQIINRDKNAVFGRSGIEADAIIAPKRSGLQARIAIGVTAADCVPLLISSKYGFAAIHADWRGLALGIIQKTLHTLLGSDKGSLCEVIIGPCAGSVDYEVGPEVIAGIGPFASATSVGSSDKSLLNLPETARNILASSGYHFSCASCDISTISDGRFHSHRRDGDSAGRGLGFMIVPS